MVFRRAVLAAKMAATLGPELVMTEERSSFFSRVFASFAGGERGCLTPPGPLASGSVETSVSGLFKLRVLGETVDSAHPFDLRWSQPSKPPVAPMDEVERSNE